MRMRRFCLLLVLLPLSLLIVFSGVSIDAYAAYTPDIPAGGKYLLPEDALGVFDRSLTVKVWTGSSYATRTATYSGTQTGFHIYEYLSDSNNTVTESTINPINPSTVFLKYTFSLSGLVNNDNYPAVIFDLPFTLTDTNYFYTAAIMYGDTITASSPKPVWNWNVGGQSTDFSSAFASLNAYATFAMLNGVSPNRMFVPAFYTSDSFTSVSSLTLTFPRAFRSDEQILYIACPYVASSGGVSAEPVTTAPATTSSPTTGTDINVNVDVDMTETNGLLDRIRETLGGLVDGIKDLFVPDEEDVILWKQDIAQILDDTFGGIPQLEGDLQNTVTQLISTQATSSIDIPDLSIPYVGTLITARSVPLKPSGFDVLFDAIRLGADIVVTVWVFNMVQDKIKALLVGETVVDRIGD